MSNFIIRKATIEDVEKIVYLIKQLAIYEKLEHEAIVTKEQIVANVFNQQYAHVLIAEENDETIGFALYFFNFSLCSSNSFKFE